MNLSRIDYTYYFFDSRRHDTNVYIILHALLHCLTEVEIENAYFTYGQQDKSFKSTLESFILKRTSEKPGLAYLQLASNLVDKLENEVDFKKRRPYLSFLHKIIRNMPVYLIEKYFTNLINSSRLSDRNYAYQAASLIWTEKVKEILIKLFDEHLDIRCLEVLVEKLTDEELFMLVKESDLWDNDYFHKRIRRDIIKRLSAFDISEFDIVKEYDISSYIYLLSLKRHQCTGSDFKNLIDTIPDDQKINKIWFLGLLGDWDSIVNLIEY